MPATEQTWREPKLMHLIFGLSSLAMLGTTIWMLAADHRREWKEYQRSFQDLEAWTSQSRIDQAQSAQYLKTKEAAQAALDAARLQIPSQQAINNFIAAVKDVPAIKDSAGKAVKGAAPDTSNVEAAYEALLTARDPLRAAGDESGRKDLEAAVIEKRKALVSAMQGFVSLAKFREDELNTSKKFKAADLDVVRSEFELGVGKELPKERLAEFESQVTAARAIVEGALLNVQDAKEYRLKLERALAVITDPETLAKKQSDDVTGKITQLEKSRDEQEFSVMKFLTEMPILDAFGRPIEIKQVWLPTLPINYNFGVRGDVARYDRCITCHAAIEKSAPGAATKAGYSPLEKLTLQLETPAERPAGLDEATDEGKLNKLLDEVYGIQFAKVGLFDPSSATIAVIRPDKLGAKAQLEVGDVIKSIGGSTSKVFSKRDAFGYLLQTTNWGKPLAITVERGVPQPFSSHPRLDLFVGSLSPHKMQDIGCTICHDGQGSATAFKWASHSPDDVFQASDWKEEHGWFDNHNWIYPMYPKRFSESLCLKCHHEVVELEPSDRFPDPPAPKLVEGFHLIEQFGCFGCHEINGFDGPNRRIGPDLRTQPNTAAAAEALLAIGGMTEQQTAWAKELVERPSNDAMRRGLLDSLRNAPKLPGDPLVTKKIVTLLEDIETPGKLRKVGPSLRHVASKNDFDFLFSWIRKPSDFRPSTKMPQFFGLYNRLTDVDVPADKRKDLPKAEQKALHDTEQFEPLEIRGIAEFLLASSQPFAYATPANGVQAASPERGKLLFETRGCLACHKHDDFPGANMTQGPDLSRIGGKLSHRGMPDGEKWLYTWLKNPSSYHTRTMMPNLQLDVVAAADGKKTDPIADLVSFLSQSGKSWVPQDIPSRELTADERIALFDLAFESLRTTFTDRKAKEFLKNGIPEEMRSDLKGDEIELLGPMTDAKQVKYVGRRAISKYGCAGCHDIPGFEDAKPIGTGLADWARKTADKLAFEQIVEYMKYGHGQPKPLREPAGPGETDSQIEEADHGAYGHTELNPHDMPPDTGYFVEKLLHHQREGFIWQKLREPRSYDYKKVENKPYNDRLRMPQFNGLNDEQREAIITFVMGLVAEPPPVQYVYKPTPRREAIVQGQQLIERYNCTGCHKLSMERWDIAYAPSDFADPAPVADFEFLLPSFTPKQIEESLATDVRGLRRATLVGMPLVDQTGKAQRLDDGGAPIEDDDKTTPAFYAFTPWQNVLINGLPRQSGLQNILVPEARIEKRYPSQGGFLTNFAFATVVAEEKKQNPNAKAEEAFGWLPPPLVGEGRKVQTPWLHDFLLDPHEIRPATVLRMPKFNMSHNDATKLANYFAAVDGVGYPYEFDPRTRENYLATADEQHPHRFDDALKIVTDNSFCIKCHLLGDYSPQGSDRAKAPRLDDVYKRLRPEWVVDWTANPKRILPYTPMPVNIPFDKPVSQDLFKGDSVQQLNGVADLLLNFDRFLESKTNIKSYIKAPPPGENPPGQAAAAQ